MHSNYHTYTCGVDRNYIVIAHDGKFSQCQMHLEKNFDNSTSMLNFMPKPTDRFIQNLHIDEKTECQTCTFRYRCTGGCPLETHRVTGTWSRKSPHCNIYKTLYPQILHLEGLRLLKKYKQGILQ